MFRLETEGSVEKWLTDKGSKFERDAKDRRKLDLDVKEDAMILRHSAATSLRRLGGKGHGAKHLKENSETLETT